MNADVTKAVVGAVIVFASGVGVGVAIGHNVGKKAGAKQAWGAAEVEMDELEDRLKRQYKIDQYSAPFTTIPEPVVPRGENGQATFDFDAEEVVATSAERLQELVQHIETQGYATKEMTETPEQGDIFEQYKNEDEEEGVDLNPNMDDPEPYVISEEEFTHGLAEEFQKIYLSYYPGDGVVCDEQDRVVEDVESAIGINNLAGFSDEDVVLLHIRNSRLQADFEITREVGSYREAVLGVEPGPVMERRGRRSKVDQDE